MKNRIQEHPDRRKILIGFILLIFCALIIKLIYIQILSYGDINKSVKDMIFKENVEDAKRGDILDTNGSILATSIRRYRVFLDPKNIKNYDEVKKVLETNGIKLNKNSLKEYGDTGYVPIPSDLSESEMRKIHAKKIKGIGFDKMYIRQYPEGKMLSHILGILGKEGNGLDGIEKNFNHYLAGDKIKQTQYRDGTTTVVNDKYIDKTKMAGENVELTIDKNLQFIAEQELREAFVKYKPKRAMAIIQNPKTGAILAMVSLPDFSLSGKVDDISKLRNSTISDIFEPGSTFKIVATAGALNESKVKLDDKFYLEDGKYKIGSNTIKDDHQIKGYATIVTILEQSSNIGTVKIAQKLGKEKFYEYIRKFGFYSSTGIDLPGEAKGLLAETQNWNSLSLPTIAFGQGVGVTALQVINAFSAIANDGILMRPTIIKRIANEDISQYESKAVRKVISKQTAIEMRKLLRNVVDYGTGRSAGVSGYSIAGKTGTAQKINPKTKTYSTQHYVASFVGMIPATEPELVILVVLDEPKGNYYAASVASPVFAKIAKRAVQYLNIPKDVVGVKK